MSDKDNSKASSAMSALLKEHTFTMPKIGDTIVGTVADISENKIHVDIDGLSTGIIRGRELYDESGEYSNLKIGDQIEATVVDLENENGEIELSLRFTGHQKAWNKLAKLAEDGDIIKVKIISANTGGLMAKYGKLIGFLPVSQLAPEHYPRVEGGDRQKILEKLNALVNKTLNAKILTAEEEEEKLIFSEKAAWEELQKSKLSKIKVGDVVEGKITGVVDFGVFIEFDDGLEGLIHISELGWQRIDNPNQLVKVGDKIKAQIIEIEGSKISLSRKRLIKDPWQEVNKKYKVGDTVKGKVLKVNPFGLFVELDNDIHGLAHVSELSDKKIAPNKIAKPGDILEFKIISLEPKEHRLGLSIKALQEKDKKEETGKEEKKEKEDKKTEKKKIKEGQENNKQDKNNDKSSQSQKE